MCHFSGNRYILIKKCFSLMKHLFHYIETTVSLGRNKIRLISFYHSYCMLTFLVDYFQSYIYKRLTRFKLNNNNGRLISCLFMKQVNSTCQFFAKIIKISIHPKRVMKKPPRRFAIRLEARSLQRVLGYNQSLLNGRSILSSPSLSAF